MNVGLANSHHSTVGNRASPSTVIASIIKFSTFLRTNDGSVSLEKRPGSRQVVLYGESLCPNILWRKLGPVMAVFSARTP